MRRDPLNEFSISSAHRSPLDRLDTAPHHNIHHDLPSSTTGTKLHALVWRDTGPGPRYLVWASLGFSSPDILETRMIPDRMWCCTHRSPTDTGRTLPNPSRWSILIAQPSHAFCCCPHHSCQFGLSAAQGQNSLSFWTMPSQPDHSTSRLLPLWIFSWSCIQESLHRQTPQYCCPTRSMDIYRSFVGICVSCNSLEDNEVLCARKAIFRINSFTEYKMSGLSAARKLNLATTLWNNCNSSPLRRSSSSLTSSGGSCHFAVLNNSLTSLAFGPPASSVPAVASPLASVRRRSFKARETCCWSGLYSIPPKVATSVFCERNSLSVTATTRGPESRLCSARITSQRTHCMPSPLQSTHNEKIIAVHQNVRLQVFVKKWHGDATHRGNLPVSKT